MRKQEMNLVYFKFGFILTSQIRICGQFLKYLDKTASNASSFSTVLPEQNQENEDRRLLAHFSIPAVDCNEAKNVQRDQRPSIIVHQAFGNRMFHYPTFHFL